MSTPLGLAGLKPQL